MFWDKSVCKKEKYHAFETEFETDEATREVCQFCGLKVVFKKDPSGRIHNNRYLKYHIRDFAQPYGPSSKVFEQIYGKTGIKDISHLQSDKTKEKERKRLEAMDYWNTLKKTSL